MRTSTECEDHLRTTGCLTKCLVGMRLLEEIHVEFGQDDSHLKSYRGNLRGVDFPVAIPQGKVYAIKKKLFNFCCTK